MTRRVPTMAILLMGVVLAVCAGCVRMPDSGPVTVLDQDPGQDLSAEVDYIPPGPTAGESPTEIVQHFLGAMRATSHQTSVARLFLTPEAAQEWAPEEETVVYETMSRPEPVAGSGGAGDPGGDENATSVAVDLTGTAEVDAQGSWDASAPTQRRFTFQLTSQDGEWRISTPPDALIVPLSWFEARNTKANVYFLDPTASIVVPSPIYVSEGSQAPDLFATRLVAALLDGPADSLTDVVSTALDEGSAPGLRVEVSNGLASIFLTAGEGAPVVESLTEQMVAQLSWTLRQVSAVTRFRVLLDDVSLRGPDGGESFNVNGSQRYSPNVQGATSALFGLSGQTLVRVGSNVSPVEGADAIAAVSPTSVTVSLDGTSAAAVGTQEVVVASLSEPTQAVTRIEVVGTAQTSWDFAGRLWILDSPGEARLRVMVRGSVQTVVAPGISGAQVRQVLISRDGSRLAAIVGAEADQRVLVARVRIDAGGDVAGVTPPIPLSVPFDDDEVAWDLGWRSAAELIVLSSAQGAVELQPASVDGSAVGVDDVDVVLSDARRLVCSPVPGTPLLLEGTSVEEVDGTQLIPVPNTENLTALTYAG